MCWAKAGADGTPLRPSGVAGRIRKLFPKLSVIDEDHARDLTRQITGAENALPYLTECLPRLLEKEAGAEEEALFDWFLHQPQYREKIQTLVKAATQTRRETGLGRQVAQALYGQNLENSVSRLERDVYKRQELPTLGTAVKESAQRVHLPKISEIQSNNRSQGGNHEQRTCQNLRSQRY